MDSLLGGLLSGVALAKRLHPANNALTANTLKSWLHIQLLKQGVYQKFFVSCHSSHHVGYQSGFIWISEFAGALVAKRSAPAQAE
jgi:hypothetical protein